jgi:hypothetical protein
MRTFPVSRRSTCRPVCVWLVDHACPPRGVGMTFLLYASERVLERFAAAWVVVEPIKASPCGGGRTPTTRASSRLGPVQTIAKGAVSDTCPTSAAAIAHRRVFRDAVDRGETVEQRDHLKRHPAGATRRIPPDRAFRCGTREATDRTQRGRFSHEKTHIVLARSSLLAKVFQGNPRSGCYRPSFVAARVHEEMRVHGETAALLHTTASPVSARGWRPLLVALSVLGTVRAKPPSIRPNSSLPSAAAFRPPAVAPSRVTTHPARFRF